MITASEIRKKALRKYDTVAKSSLRGEHYFPMLLRSNKRLSKDFVQMGLEIAQVLEGSKDHKGFGYQVVSEPVKTRSHGVQDIPKAIVFDSLRDYLKFIGKEREFYQMMEDYEFARQELSHLEGWLQENPVLVSKNAGRWNELVRVCKWFIHHFEPGKYYIRELPIAVHTKFIEENKGVIRRLLDELIPDKVNVSETLFEKRFGLKYDQALVRFRSLDASCGRYGGFYDMSVPVEQFEALAPNFRRVFIIENKMNFLTFPKVPDSIAIWGQGFALESLKHCQWLKEMDIYYWSDLDVQGFQMLSQLKSYFPQSQSFLMSMDVVEKYREFVVVGTLSPIDNLPYLTETELRLYNYLSDNNLRLEQERIEQEALLSTLNAIIG